MALEGHGQVPVSRRTAVPPAVHDDDEGDVKMKKQHVMVALGAIGAMLVALLVPAAAQQEPASSRTYVADLATLNDSGAQGTATLTISGTQLTVEIDATGLSPNLPHAQHLHGAFDREHVCPPPSADTDGDGFISVAEGVPFYGGIQVSLTTTGDTSADSALDLDRFPVADETGNLTYSRTFAVTEQVAENLELLHVVQHGIDLDDSGAYDGEKRSSIADVPFEATVPADCGEIELTAANGMDASRIAGETRYGTAVEVSQRAYPDGAATVYLATGEAFADALSGAMLAADAPLLLVPSCGELPAVVAAEIARLGPSEVIALGGVNAVCASMIEQATAAA